MIDINLVFLGLTSNTDKTKFMPITEARHLCENIRIKSQAVEKVRAYKYIATVVDENNE